MKKLIFVLFSVFYISASFALPEANTKPYGSVDIPTLAEYQEQMFGNPFVPSTSTHVYTPGKGPLAPVSQTKPAPQPTKQYNPKENYEIDQLQRYYEGKGPGFVGAASKGVLLTANSDIIKLALEAHFPTREARGNALAQYHAFVKQNGGKGVVPKQIWDICAAGGMDIKTADGRKKCDNFVRSLKDVYVDVCAKKQKNCVTSFKGVNTQMRQGVIIANAWAKSQQKDIIKCKEEYTTRSNDDYLFCRSIKKPGTYYTFQFDDLNESKDATAQRGAHEAVCAMAGLQFTSGGFSNPTFGSTIGASIGGGSSWPDKCNTQDGKKCSTAAVKAFAKELGFAISYDGQSGCTFSSSNIYNVSEIVNEYPNLIDNYVYSSGKDQTQLQAMPSLDESIRMYAQTKLGNIDTFKCDGQPKRWIRGALEDNEDVLTCRINGKRVDFVFDDLTQSTALWGSAIIDGSKQGLGCRAMGGIFDGEHCADLTESMCKQVAALNLKECPGCKAAYWDADKQICMLPESSNAKTIKTTVRVVTNTGIAVVALVATVASGGSVLMVTAAATATVAAATSDTAKIIQDNDASDWVVEMNKINTPEQADAFLRKHLNEIMGADHLDEPRRNGLDEMLSRVLSKTSDTYFKELVSGCIAEPQEGEVYYDTSLPTCALNPKNGSNTLSTVIRVADTVQFIAGVVMLVAGLTHTVQTITSRTTQIVDKIDDLKNTGWIRQNGQWVNQTTGEVAKSLPKGVPGWDPNPALRGGGRWRGLLYGNGNTGSFTKKADLIRWITENRVEQVVSKVWNPNWTVVAGGVANVVISHSDENLANVKIPERKSENVVVPDPTPVVVPDPTPVVVPDITPVVVPDITPVVDPDITPVVVPDTTLVVDQDLTPVVESTPSRNVTPHATKKKANTALIATAAVAGTIGAGWLIGSLIGKDDDKKATAPALSTSDKDLEQLMQNAGGVIGNQNGATLKLVPLPTTINSYAPIVDINGYAVVVVDYRGYRLPYYMNSKTMRWEPLLGIGTNGGWFNVYPTPSQSGIAVIDSIARYLKQRLNPFVVSRYVGQGAVNVRFPMAGPAAYQIINAEFPNGVVNINNGAMTPADQLLYNNNYQLIKQKLQ